jgi:hypothetical protein
VRARDAAVTAAERTWRRAALVVAVAAAAAVGAGSALHLSVRAAPEVTPPDLYLQDVAVGVAFPLVAAFILFHKPRNRVAWLLLIMGLGGALAVFAQEYVVAGTLGPSAPWPAVELLTILAVTSWFPFLGLVPLFLLWLPEGTLPSRRWVPLAWAVVAMNVFIVGAFGYFGAVEGPALILTDAAPEGASGSLFAVLMVGFALMLLAAFASVPLRWRRAEELERRQLKTIALAAGVGIAMVLIRQPLDSGPTALLETLGILLVPAGVPVAVLRYRLYDIDRLVSRTVAYALVMVVLAGLYVTAVVGLGALLRPLAGQSESQVVVAASTLLVAAAFQPVRHRTQDLVDRRFNRARYDAQRTVAEFAATLRDAVDLDELQHRLVLVAEATVQPTDVWLWLRQDRR